MILFAILLIDLLTGMECDLFVPSFPQLKNHFNLSAFSLELSLSINFLGFLINLFIVGILADRYGRKTIILIGLLFFIIGNIFCLLSSHYYIFLLGRFIQGIGIAAPAVLSFLIIADNYPIKRQQFLFAMLNGAHNMSVAFAPVLGSYITNYFNWQGNFITLLILGVIVFFITLLFIPNYKIVEQQKFISVVNYQTIFKSKPIILLMVYFIISFTPYWIFIGITPLLYVKDLSVSLKDFGLYQGSIALTFALGSFIFGLFISKYNPKNMLIKTKNMLIFSMISMLIVTVFNGSHPFIITLTFIFFIITQIIPTTILYPLYLNLMPHAKGKLTACIQGGRLILAALGLQIASYFYHGTFFNIGLLLSIIIFMNILGMIMILKNWSEIKQT